MIDKDRYIKAYCTVFDISEDKVRAFLKTRHISSLIDNADNLLTGIKQKQKYEAFKSLYTMSEAVLKDIEEVNTQEKVIAYARASMKNMFDREVFCMLTLNSKLEPISAKVISEGSISSANVDIRNIFKYALQDNASGVIFFHNHPSGDLTPSRADIGITKELYTLGKKLDIDILDHFIVSGYDKNKYFSLRANRDSNRSIWDVNEDKKAFSFSKSKDMEIEF